MKEKSLSENQKLLIKSMRAGDFLFENRVTPGAKWCLGKDYGKWGNVNGNMVNGILNLVRSERLNMCVNKYVLNDLGKTIKL